MWCPCPGCGAELRVTERMLAEADRVLISRFAQCLYAGGDPCLHAFTVMLDGQVTREDAPCDCGRPRAVLDMRSVDAVT